MTAIKRIAPIAILGAMVCLPSLTCSGKSGSHSANILFITVDTLRADHLSVYGYSRKTSPTIDALAEEGIVFKRMYAQRGLTWPSLASILTSQYPHQHGVRDNWMMLSGTEPTIASVLLKNGYQCAAFLTNTSKQQYAGFDLVEGQDALPYTNDISATQNALAWLRNRTSREPFFVWVHYIAPHAPYEPPDPYADRFMPSDLAKVETDIELLLEYAVQKTPPEPDFVEACIAQYDGAIAFIDNEINTLLQTLKALDLYDRTLIAFTSDHGEELFQHNAYSDHYASVYSAVTHVPFIMRLPNTSREGETDAVVQTLDIAPTILAALGLKSPEEFQGVNLLEVLDGTQEGQGFAVAEWEDKILTITTEEYVYVDNPLNFSPTVGHARLQPEYRDAVFEIAESELYDIGNDPREQINIVDYQPEVAERLQEKLISWARRYGWAHNTMPGTRELDEETRQALEAMGYLR